MLVNSEALERGATEIRRRRKGPQRLASGPLVSAAQLDTAARILRETEPSVITSASGPVKVTVEPQERPGFIEGSRQKDPEVLAFTVGIIPSDTYYIDRRGEVVSIEP